jgi:hypothetical protein
MNSINPGQVVVMNKYQIAVRYPLCRACQNTAIKNTVYTHFGDVVYQYVKEIPVL